jgi:sugar phosphate isomerase/epimerase
MKLAFTTLACPSWTLRQIVEQAAKLGFDAIDFRGLLDSIDITERPEFTTEIDATKRLIGDHGLVVSCLSISARYAVVAPEAREEQFAETRRNMELAAELGAPMLRVYGGRVPDGETQQSILPALADNLAAMVDEAEGYGVTLGIETHDDWTDSMWLGQLMAAVDHPRSRVIWDLHHPYRVAGETPEQTYGNVGSYVAGIHVKDSVASNGDHRYVPVGQGDVPLKEMLDLIVAGGYEGYATLEWEKRWKPELPGPEQVLPSYVEQMRAWGFAG